MISDREQLEKIFSEFSDEELLKRWASGHLTAAAQSVAASEAKSRDLQLAPYWSDEQPDDEPSIEPDHEAPEYLGDWVLISREISRRPKPMFFAVSYRRMASL